MATIPSPTTTKPNSIVEYFRPKKPEPVKQTQSLIAVAGGRAYECLSNATWAGATLFKTIGNTDKTFKFLRSFATWAQVNARYNEIPATKAGIVSDFLGNQTDFFAALCIIDRAKEWTEIDVNGRLKMMNLLESNPTEFTSKTFMALGNICDTTKWINAHVVKVGDVIDSIGLGEFAAKVGELPVFSTFNRLGLAKSKNVFVISSSVFKIISIIDTALEKADKTKKPVFNTKDSLSLACEVGKIFVSFFIFKGMILTYAFVASGLFTGMSQTSKVLYEAAAEERAEAERARLAAERAQVRPGIFARLVGAGSPAEVGA